MYLEPSARPEKVIDFDKIKEYEISGEAFKSWNSDQVFDGNGHNAVYFQYTKPYKVRVDFIVSLLGQKLPFGFVDVVSWMPHNPSFEIRPTALHLLQLKDDITFDFYVHSFPRDRKTGFFEPRVYKGFHTVEAIKITKLLTLKENKKCQYTLFLIKRAKEMFDLATEKCREGDYGLANHFARLTIEFSVKSVFSALGRQFTLTHHPKVDKNRYKEVREKVPDFPLTRLLWISEKYAEPSRKDFYGNEEAFEPSYTFVDHDEAVKAVEYASFCYENATLFVDNVLRA